MAPASARAIASSSAERATVYERITADIVAAIECGCHFLARNAWQIKEKSGIVSHGECGASGDAAD
jgi:hypothetical protein